MTTSYLISGDDEYRIYLKHRELVNSYAATHVPVTMNADSDLDSTVFGMSLFANAKIITIPLNQYIKNKDKDKEEEKAEMSPLESWLMSRETDLAGLSSDTVLIYRYTGILDKRRKLTKLLEKLTTEKHEINAFKPWQLKEVAAWIAEYASTEGISIEQSAIQLMVSYFETNSAYIASELTRLQAYAGYQTITAQHVEAACLSHGSTAKLAHAINTQDKITLVHTLQEIASDNNQLIPTIAYLQSMLRSYLHMISLRDAGMNPAQIAAETKGHPYKIGEDLKKIRHLTIPYVWTLITILNRNEEYIKTGKSTEQILELTADILQLL